MYTETPLPIYIGWDHRQPIAYNVLQHSILRRSSQPVSICPLVLGTLPLDRVGLTPFTFSRYLVPWLQGFEGWALFMDADILVLEDIAELFALADDQYAVMLSRNARQFEWASVMLFNCSHPANRKLTSEWVADKGSNPFKFGWLPDGTESGLIGGLPGEWNHLVGYDEPRNDAKAVHYTMGIPPFEETNMCEYAQAWGEEHQSMNGAVPWIQLMGNSVHATHLPDGRVLPHFHPDVKNG